MAPITFSVVLDTAVVFELVGALIDTLVVAPPPPPAPAPLANIGALLALLAQSSGGRGSTTINNITVAPSSSNTVSSVNKSENTYGTVDPYTAASGAYG